MMYSLSCDNGLTQCQIIQIILLIILDFPLCPKSWHNFLCISIEIDCLKNEVDLFSFVLSDISFPTSLMNLYPFGSHTPIVSFCFYQLELDNIHYGKQTYDSRKDEHKIHLQVLHHKMHNLGCSHCLEAIVDNFVPHTRNKSM